MIFFFGSGSDFEGSFGSESSMNFFLSGNQTQLRENCTADFFIFKLFREFYFFKKVFLIVHFYEKSCILLNKFSF